MPLYCSKGHENPTGTRFCQHCGEKLSLPTRNNWASGSILGDRYRIVTELGQGGKGRTYLAVDRHRFNEPCVLKEFAPQVQGSYALQKALELFEREAGVLYKLQHPQIPRFRELFRVNIEGIDSLFLVQDYVEGQTYRTLLDARSRRRLRFSEPEVTQLLLQILPVLQYIHYLGVIHRDISPDNLMRRSSDGLPVLIDFGGVKEIAATVESQLNPDAARGIPPIATRLGKVGYAPPEQMQSGIVFPHSDLYALAVTVLVLLAGKNPQQLINYQTLTWEWRREVSVSPTLGSVLDKMLQPLASDRYQSAREVLQALTGNLPTANYPPAVPPDLPATEAKASVASSPSPPQTAPESVSPTASPAAPLPPVPTQQSCKFYGAVTLRFAISLLGKILVVLVMITIAGAIGWWAGNLWIQYQSERDRRSPQPTRTQNSSSVDPEAAPQTQFSPQERQRKLALRRRRTALGIEPNLLVDLVNQAFWHQVPTQQERILGNGPLDERLREQWDKKAAELLDKIEQANLSSSARQRMGSYNAAERAQWKVEVNKLHLGSRSLYDLTDGQYGYFFPDYTAKKLNLTFDEFLNKPIGQLWHAIAADKVQAVKSGDALETISFDPGTTSKQLTGTLAPGEGKAFIARFVKGELMNVQLQIGEQASFSVYSPTGNAPILEDSPERTWSGQLPESGYYEFIVVCNASEPIDYQLNLTVETPSPTPSPEPSESEPPG